jgi:Holliday junction resolvase RusA-like endonuclease
MIEVCVLSLPPSSNRAYINVRGGGRALSTEGRKYKTETTAFLAQNYPSELKQILPDTKYFCYVRFYFEAVMNKEGAQTRYKRLDTSNRLKLFEDCLKDACGIDDSQFFIWTIEKRQGDERTECFIWDMEKEELPIDNLVRF